MKYLVVAGALFLVVGCYEYAPTPLGTVAPGATVRVDLTDLGSAGVAPYVGDRVRSLGGRVSHIDSTGLELSVSEVTRSSDLSETWPSQAVLIPSAGIATVNLSKLSSQKSLLAVGGLFVGAGALARAILGGSAFGGHGTPPPPGK